MNCPIELEVIENPTIEMDVDVIVEGNVEVEELNVTANGTYQETGKAYSPVNVNVPGIIPAGTLNIDTNGLYNVAQYENADVDIPAPVLINKAITANGNYAAADDSADGFANVSVNVPKPPVWWIGEEWERMADCWDETTNLKDVGFDAWTASNTAGTLRASGAANQFSADVANYDYLIRWRFLWTAAYNPGATMNAIPVCGATEIYQLLTRRPLNLAQVHNEEYNQNVAQQFFTMAYQEYYNTSGNHVCNWGNTYGVTVTAAAPNYGGGDNITVTPNYPSIGARCNNSYFNTSRKADIDSENSPVRIVGEVYRVKKSALRQTYEAMVDIANNGL